jgi:hypothetical protein
MELPSAELTLVTGSTVGRGAVLVVQLITAVSKRAAAAIFQKSTFIFILFSAPSFFIVTDHSALHEQWA